MNNNNFCIKCISVLSVIIYLVLGILIDPCYAKSDLLSPFVKVVNVSVSGISGGGYMAVQMQVAFSKSFMGAGVIAAGPYYCAQSDVEIALTTCMDGTPEPSVDLLTTETSNLANLGQIDSPDNMNNHRVYVFSGTKDTVVKQPVVTALLSYYKEFVNPANIEKELTIAAEHAMITYNYGNDCNVLAEPFINHCSGSSRIQVAHQIIRHIYPQIPPMDRSLPTNESNLHEFDQHQFISPMQGFQKTGYVYIPTACRSARAAVNCRLHVAFHGCEQGTSFIGDKYIKNAGYNDIAEANNIIIIYPQVEPSEFPFNPKGCFDWWGYTNPIDYFVKVGPQMNAVKQMIRYFGAEDFDA